MSKKPFYNAVLAAGYISIVALGINWTSRLPDSSGNIFVPMGMISLLVLSVSIMAFLFFYQPVILLIDKKPAEAAKLLACTIGIFAIFTAAFLATAYFFLF